MTQLFHGLAYVFKSKMPENSLGHILSNYLDTEAGLRSLIWPMSVFEYSLEGNGLVFLFVCVHLSFSALPFPHFLVDEDEFPNIMNYFFFLI